MNRVELGEGFRGPQGRLAFLLRQAHGAWRLALERELAPLELTGPQYSALNVIALLPGLSGSELARSSLLTQQTVNEILIALERRGLIVRSPRVGNARILEIGLTSTGTEVVRKARRLAYRLEARMTAGLNDLEKARLREWLVACARNLVPT